MDIKISKSARACRACEREFVHEEPVYSVVRVLENELAREDVCAACWKAERAADAYSHWNTKYYDPRVAEQEPAEVFSPLRQLFYEAVEAEDRVQQAKAFLAAQLLRRQKVFRQIKESDEADGEIKIVLFNDRIGNRLIEVRDPHFTYAELELGRVQLMMRLQELEAPAPAPEPVAAAEAPTEDAREDGVSAGQEDVDADPEDPKGDSESDASEDYDGEEESVEDEDGDDEDEEDDEDEDEFDDDPDDDDEDDDDEDEFDDDSDDDEEDDDDELEDEAEEEDLAVVPNEKEKKAHV